MSRTEEPHRELQDIPSGMNAHVDHDGVRWQFGGSLLAVLLAVIVSIASLGLAIEFGPVGVGIAAVIWLVSLLVILQNLQRTTISVGSRFVLVEQRAFGRLERQQIRLDEITSQSVAQNTRGDSALVLRTRDETITVANGQAETHLRWLDQVVAHARAISTARDQQEGREWRFLRKPPDAIERVIDRS